MSEWQIPQNLMSIRTSFGPSSRRSISKGPSGASGANVPTARAVVVFEAGGVKVLVAMRRKVGTHLASKGVLLTPVWARIGGWASRDPRVPDLAPRKGHP